MIKISQKLARLPAYLPGKPVEALAREIGITGAIKLASNENPLGPSPKGIAALRGSIKEIHRYPDSRASLLREGLANKWDVPSEQIIIGNGSDEILALLTRALLQPGEQAIMAHPSFALYRIMTLASYGRPLLIPLPAPGRPSENGRRQALPLAGRHPLSQMADLAGKRTRLIFICNPNNPTGTIVYQEEVESFLTRLPRSVLVVFDEAYAEYATHPRYPSSLRWLKKGAPIFFLRTFSKIYGLAGLRIGYGIGPPDLIQLLDRIRQPFNANLLAQKAALAALGDNDHLKRSQALNEEGKQYLYQQFDRMGIPYLPTEANFIYFSLYAKQGQSKNGKGFHPKGFHPNRLGSDALAKEIYNALLQKGVIVRPIEGPHLRVTIGKRLEMRRFIHSLDEICRSKI